MSYGQQRNFFHTTHMNLCYFYFVYLVHISDLYDYHNPVNILRPKR